MTGRVAALCAPALPTETVNGIREKTTPDTDRERLVNNVNLYPIYTNLLPRWALYNLAGEILLEQGYINKRIKMFKGRNAILMNFKLNLI